MNTPATIAISIKSICASIYARTAIRHTLDPNRPPMLTQPMQPALEQLICSTFTTLCLETGASPAARDEDILSTTIHLVPQVNTAAIRAAFERIISLRLLAEAYASVDRAYSTQMNTFADTSLAAVKSFTTTPAPHPRKTPHIF